MEPITTAAVATVLTPLVSGAATAAGEQAWHWLSDRVATTFGRTSAVGAALERARSNPNRQQIEEASRVVAVAAEEDAGFGAALRVWLDRSQHLALTDGQVSNNIGAATIQGPVVQARDIAGGVSFGNG
ncbi:hypothetical protein ACQPZK_19425 [Micromonospora sp. CA-249363]|uniref:hypothetical protein n=1 Tax=Micromonospora sp. CA-249363 TaxID=3239963 RepID=UPI003D8A2EC8